MFMGPTWGTSGADMTQVGPMNFAMWACLSLLKVSLFSLQRSRSTLLTEVTRHIQNQWKQSICLLYHFWRFLCFHITVHGPLFWQKLRVTFKTMETKYMPAYLFGLFDFLWRSTTPLGDPCSTVACHCFIVIFVFPSPRLFLGKRLCLVAQASKRR